MHAIRKGDWKYVPEGSVANRGKIGIFNPDKIATSGALFLPEDSAEQNNLAYKFPAKAAEMKTLLVKEGAPHPQKIKCECIHYATESQRNLIICFIDSNFIKDDSCFLG